MYAVAADVQDVYIAGKQVVRDGQVLTVNVNIEDWFWEEIEAAFAFSLSFF